MPSFEQNNNLKSKHLRSANNGDFEKRKNNFEADFQKILKIVDGSEPQIKNKISKSQKKIMTEKVSFARKKEIDKLFGLHKIISTQNSEIVKRDSLDIQVKNQFEQA